MSDKDQIRMVCKTCGSCDVTKDATARWDAVLQRWVLIDTLDSADCASCGGEATVVEQTQGDFQTHLLADCQSFIEGFEGDSTQEGVDSMLARLRGFHQ